MDEDDIYTICGIFEKYYWEISLVLSIIFFIILLLFYDRISYYIQDKEEFKIYPPLWQRNYAKIGKKNETKVRDILEKIFNDKFPTVRPNFLKSSVSGKNLELDCYNERLNLAVEYHGEQHYKFTKFFHRTYDTFEKQLSRDKEKYHLCKKRGINLIVVPYILKDNELEPYLRYELKKLNYLK